MAQYGDMMDFIRRFQTLQLQRESSDELIKDLLIHAEAIESGLRAENQRITDELKLAKLDLADSVKSRRELQLRLQDAETRADYYSQGSEIYRNRNQYIVVLIDGDGLFFKESIVKQGLEGGKRAAEALRVAILKQCGEHAGEIEVVAKVCANLSALAKALRRDGSLQSETDLKDFFSGFSQGKASFDFVDMGQGEASIKDKFKEITSWNLRNFNCRQVVLGVSHDASYSPFLSSILQDENTQNMITILEGFPTVPELVATNVNIVNFTDTLFRSEKLVDRVPQNPSPGATPASAAAALATAAAKTTSPPPPFSSVGTPGGPPPSYAGVISAKASPPPTLVLPLAPKAAEKPSRPAKPAPWNPGKRGLDPPIQVNQAALDGIKKRKDNNKLCNNHYLRGPCAKGSSCCFEHNYRPNAEEKVAIAFLARLNPCTNGQDCDVQDCIYGHHCPSTINGQCTHPYCKFRPDEHPPGTKYKPTYRNGDYSS